MALLQASVPLENLDRSPICISVRCTDDASDLKLTIDAVDLLHESPVDTFVIVSSDSDFIPLVTRLREAGKIVYVAGRRPAVSDALVNSSDRFFDLADADEESESRSAKDHAGLEELAVRAVNAARDDEGKVTGAKLHQTMRRMDPGFDFKRFGFDTLTRLLESLHSTKVTRPGGPGDVRVELAPSVTQTGSKADSWDAQIDIAWQTRAGTAGAIIAGTTAASEAAKVLGVQKLSDSTYPKLQNLLDASPMLRSNWTRQGNRIVRN